MSNVIVRDGSGTGKALFIDSDHNAYAHVREIDEEIITKIALKVVELLKREG